jgi:hypothetical protein
MSHQCSRARRPTDAYVEDCTSTPAAHPGADLTVVKAPNQPNNVTGFCKAGNQAVILVVRDLGDTAVPSASVKIDFSTTAGTVSQTSPASVPARGDIPVVEIPIPQGCFHTDCNFHITVDSGTVPDTNAGNNSAGGRCIG